MPDRDAANARGREIQCGRPAPHVVHPRWVMGEIFISYQRLDSATFSQWLAERLRTGFGINRVFIDIRSIRDADVWAVRD